MSGTDLDQEAIRQKRAAQRIAQEAYGPQKTLYWCDPMTGKVFIAYTTNQEREDEHLATGWHVTREAAVADKSRGKPE